MSCLNNVFCFTSINIVIHQQIILFLGFVWGQKSHIPNKTCLVQILLNTSIKRKTVNFSK